jgi:hypothetical protein
MFRALLTIVLSVLVAAPAAAQSQAVNGNIEGIVRDTSGAVLPGVTVTVTNVDTGAERVVVTNERGVYRAPLVPLGTYRVRAEVSGFRPVERSGITLSAGQTAQVNVTLEVGGLEEVVEVTADSPVTEPAKVDLGRTIGEEEIRNLPNIARNTFNFALLQPNVTGFENEEFGATRMNANGSQMRTNYQIDGSSATQKDRAGLRMFQPSEIMVKEVRVTTSGFAPEFGQTTGMVYNAVTPSGTNALSGQASYRFRRNGMAERPRHLAVTAPKPELKVDNFTGALGGPIMRDRVHFYGGYERLVNDLSAGRVIAVTPANIAALGLSSEAIGNGVIPAVQTVNMFISKVDAQINPNNRMSARWSVFNNTTPENIGGGLNTREIATDFQDRMDSAQAQLISTIGRDKLNELRIAYGRRNNPRVPSGVAGPGPQINVTGAAVFGGSPTATEFRQEYYQVVNNFSLFRGRHSLKAGLDFQFIDDFRQSSVHPTYIFPNVAAYLAATSGANPFGYTRFTQAIGDPTVSYSQQYFSFFLQDDFRISPAFKLLYGIRYDLFRVPEADPNAPHPGSRSFRVDRNNFGPRVGFAWSVDPEARTIVRASTGLMYEPPLGMFYQDALQESGAPRLLTASVTPTQVGAPAFPNTLAGLPPGVTPSRSIRTVNPDFATQYAVLSNVQIERGLTNDLSVAVGYVNSTGRNLPVVLNSNVVPTGQTLPDGRPIYARTPLNAATRVNPDFDTVNEIRSTGRSQYNALTLSMARRMRSGIQAQASYTLARAEDDGILGGRYVVGSSDAAALSDPSDQARDHSYTSWNVTHTFVFSGILAPRFSGDGVGTAILNNNQLGLILQANSGLPFNIRSNLDLNLDGISADRPNGVARNSGRLGNVVNVDARYSRFVPVADGMRLELFAEAKNLFNRLNVRSVNSVVATSSAGEPLAPLPTSVCEVRMTGACFPITNTYEARQVQVGFRFTF